MSLSRLSDYDYHLPEALIASRPAPSRDGARMMVIHRKCGTIGHFGVRDLPEFLGPGDLAVLNNSRVIPARLLSEDRRAEIFLLEEKSALVWECLVRPGKKFRPGSRGRIAETDYEVLPGSCGATRVIRFAEAPDLERYGRMPLPPYIRRDADSQDLERYQTVYAQEPGSVAAPTAGLHFTTDLLARIPHTFVTLHVGLGTFLPVQTPNLADHQMHTEHYSLSDVAAAATNNASRVLAVGTTSVRVLESQPPGPLTARSGSTNIFIRPPYKFRRTGALLTNFHLPRSTLLMLVCAFAGRDLTLDAYQQAISSRYRFFSYGDCMLIL